jgi:hypothetical protein
VTAAMQSGPISNAEDAFFDNRQLYIVLFAINNSNRCNRQSASHNIIINVITCGR